MHEYRIKDLLQFDPTHSIGGLPPKAITAALRLASKSFASDPMAVLQPRPMDFPEFDAASVISSRSFLQTTESAGPDDPLLAVASGTDYMLPAPPTWHESEEAAEPFRLPAIKHTPAQCFPANEPQPTNSLYRRGAPALGQFAYRPGPADATANKLPPPFDQEIPQEEELPMEMANGKLAVGMRYCTEYDL